MKQLIGSYIKISAWLQPHSPSVYRLGQSLLYGSHPSEFITKQTTHIQSHTTQVYFNSAGYPYIQTACFGLYLGHPQSCQYKNHIQEDFVFSFVCFFVLTSLRMAKVQSKTYSIHVRVTTGTKIILYCVRLNKCALLGQSLLGNYIVNIQQAAVTWNHPHNMRKHHKLTYRCTLQMFHL